MLGKFVTAKLFGKKNEYRQGWVISLFPLIIQGKSGIHYHCSGEPKLVINPPSSHWTAEDELLETEGLYER